MPRFLSIGECMIELASIGDDQYKKGFAGDTFNTAWYARLNLPSEWSVAYFTALGDDRASHDMQDFMQRSGIETDFIRRIEGKSPGLYMIHLDRGERSFSYWRSASAARQLADDEALLERAISVSDIVYFSGITLAILPVSGRENLLAAAGKARDAGKLVAFDPNLRPRLWENLVAMREWITRAARVSSLALPGFDDEAAYFGDASPLATARRYLASGVETAIVKDGAKGALIVDSQRETHVEAQVVETIVDTTAAGDSFNGSYIAARTSGKPPEQAAGFAAKIAARVIAHKGALIDSQFLLI